jgi:hypothetical protein
VSSEAHPSATVGFLWIEESAEIGYCGGYLILNALGRPLEFHCAAPVLPTRGQRILFGESLQPYLLNEAIGPALLERSSTPPDALLVAEPRAWPLAERVPCPLLLVPMRESEPHWDRLELGGQTLGRALTSRGELVALRRLLLPLAVRLPLAEPFERIRNALAEAHALAESQTHSKNVAA